MTEKISTPPAKDPLTNVPSVAISPPVRCFARRGDPSGPLCGELATWERRGNYWFSTEYFCAAHCGPADTAISIVHVYRRVHVNVDVLIAGCHVNAPVANTEAIARLERAVGAAGGVLDINTVRSDLVKSSPPAPIGARTVRSDHPE